MLPACEPGARLTAENRFPFDVTVTIQPIHEDGRPRVTGIVGIAPAGQTVVLERGVILNRGNMGDTVVLRAEDPGGKVVWEKSWPFDEFRKLEDVGWKIVIGPDTGAGGAGPPAGN